MTEDVQSSALSQLTAKKGSVYLISSLHRLGSLKFAVYLEYKYYMEVDDYQIFYIEYHGIPHYIIEVPARDMDKVSAVSQECGLKCVNGKPYGGADDFRLQCSGDACFTLESIELSPYTEEEYKRLLTLEKEEVQQYVTCQ